MCKVLYFYRVMKNFIYSNENCSVENLSNIGRENLPDEDYNMQLQKFFEYMNI